MKKAWTLMSIFAAAALCLVIGYQNTQAQAPSGGPKYGVVDLAEVMRQYSEVEAMKQKLETRAEKFKQEGQARQQKIEDLRFQRDQKHPDSPEWYKLQKEMNRLSVELEMWTKFEKQDIQAESRELQSSAYKQVLGAVELAGKQRGLDMVLHLDRVDLNDPNDLVTLQRMATRSVIYSSPTVDLTKDVVTLVNQQGASGKGAGKSK